MFYQADGTISLEDDLSNIPDIFAFKIVISLFLPGIFIVSLPEKVPRRRQCIQQFLREKIPSGTHKTEVQASDASFHYIQIWEPQKAY